VSTRGRRLVVETDGGSRGNPGPAGFGAVVRDADTGELLAEVAEAIGIATNNVAEYRGLLAGLAAAGVIDPHAVVEVRADSKLVVEQMSGRWQIKHEDMRRLAAQAREVLPAGSVRYTWVPRARNRHADRLANEAMDAAEAGRPWSLQVLPPGAEAGGGGAVGAAWTQAGSIRAPRPSGEATTLLLVRHGRTALTQSGQLSGRDGEDPPLSPAGEDDAARAAALIARFGGADTPLADIAAPSAVVCSPMRRTWQTAAAIADRLELAVTTDPDWIEIGFGAWEGLTYGEVAERFPGELAAWQGSSTAAPPGGGESLDELAARVGAARLRVRESCRGRSVVVVTHATPVRAVLQDALDAGAAALWRLRIAPAALSVVRYWDDDNAEVATVNATAHLLR
jgi:probable phosphoglycerate mutase